MCQQKAAGLYTQRYAAPAALKYLLIYRTLFKIFFKKDDPVFLIIPLMGEDHHKLAQAKSFAALNSIIHDLFYI